ncbi:MAG: 50S ribosomal protein L19e [Candidatus Thermoplasmatota archaeon]|jgi:large subunit ribosomal protein L19e|nr:50S ribosomal protein L19e [Candidatus Thermoplasmatota archaeon]MCL5962989.1 50S ribosomal protein L19e [Candidatus Thermoplasmatota archaeon]
MMFKSIRRMAADILKCGENRVWIDPSAIEDLSVMVTRADVRTAIKAGAIAKKHIQGVSRARANIIAEKKRKGKKSGTGTRKGGKHSIVTRKENWIKQIRAIRDELKMLRVKKVITPAIYRKFYKRTKSGMIKSRAHLRMHLTIEGYLKK